MAKNVFPRTDGLPLAKGVAAGGLLFLSGQVPSAGGEVTMAVQAKSALANVKSALEDCGSSVADVVKVNIFITDMNDKPAMDQAYRDFFGDDFPSRTTVCVKDLGKDVLIEIDVIAVAGE